MANAARRRASKLAKGLGLFSIGLGVSELLFPRQMGRLAGIRRPNKKLVRIYGLREIGSGIAIFASGNAPAAMWSRVAGDAVDLATLGKAMASSPIKKRRAIIATSNVAAITALDVICATRLSSS